MSERLMDRNYSEPARYVALSELRPYAGSTAVILAARKSGDPEQRVVIALSDAEAWQLHSEGRLDGWTPAAALPGDQS